MQFVWNRQKTVVFKNIRTIFDFSFWTMISMKRYLRYLGILPWTKVANRWKYIALIGFLDGSLIFQIYASIMFFLNSDQNSIEGKGSVIIIFGLSFILAWHLILLRLRTKYEVLFFDLETIVETSKLSSVKYSIEIR